MAGSKIIKRNAGAPVTAKQVKQMLVSRVEHKIAASTTNTISWSASGVVSLLSTDIAQGDNIGNRSGDSIRPLRLTIRVSSTVTTGAAPIITRFIVFQDTMANGSTPLVTDVLQTADYLSPYSPVTLQAKRFKILCDQYGTNVDGGSNKVTEVTKSFKMKGVVQYLSGSSGAAAAGKNSIYVLFINDFTAVNSIYKWSYQLEYMDA
nr:structural protein [Riboviria sp.]